MVRASILFLVTNAFPLGTGEDFIATEIDHLARAFDRVIVVTTQTRPGDVAVRPVPDNVEVIRAGGPRPSGRRALLAALRGLSHLPRSSLDHDSLLSPRMLALEAMFESHALSTEADVLRQLPTLGLRPGSRAVVYSYWFLDAARVAALLAADLGAQGIVVDRLVSRAHGYDLYKERTALGRLPQRRLLLETFDAVCPVSEHGTRRLVDEWPNHADKISTRHLGTPDPGRQAECSREPFHIVSCAYLVPVKRMARMPAILAGLRSRGVDARWTHLGDGPDLGALRDGVRAAGMDRFTDLRGHVAHTDVIDAERSLHPSCLINLSVSEGIPVSMMEAASLGIPIVGPDVGGVPEIVHGEQNGQLIPTDFTDEQAIGALSWLAGLDEERFQSVCTASRRVWEAGFDQAKVYPAFCSDVLGTPEF